jgi:hypothetical protein
MDASTLLDVHDVHQAFPKAGGGELLVLDGIDLTLKQGRDRGPARPLRFGQIHSAADHFSDWRESFQRRR